MLPISGKALTRKKHLIKLKRKMGLKNQQNIFYVFFTILSLLCFLNEDSFIFNIRKKISKTKLKWIKKKYRYYTDFYL